MKSIPPVRSLFSLSQLEMAMVLGISESLWSMHELGLRSLPLRATKILSEMLAHATNPEVAAKPTLQSKQYVTRQQQHLEKLLHDKEYQQLVIAKKIAVLTARIDAATKRQRIADFLDTQKSEKSSLESGILNMISAKAAKILTGDDPIALINLQIKQEALEYEKSIIELKLRKINQSLEIADTTVQGKQHK